MEKYIKDLTVTEFLELLKFKKEKKVFLKRIHSLDEIIKNEFKPDFNNFHSVNNCLDYISKKYNLTISKVYFGMRMKACGIECVQKKINKVNSKFYLVSFLLKT
jgi:hypothetical protein